MTELLGNRGDGLFQPKTLRSLLPSHRKAAARWLAFCTNSIGTEEKIGPFLVACFGTLRVDDKLLVKVREAGANRMATSCTKTKPKLASIVARRGRIH